MKEINTEPSKEELEQLNTLLQNIIFCAVLSGKYETEDFKITIHRKDK